MKFEDLKLNQIVQIVADGDWKNLYGIVEEIDYDKQLAFIFCIKFPYYRYRITSNNLCDIKPTYFK